MRSRSPSSRRSRWAIARRELQSLRAEKTIVLALAIQLFIAAFSSFLVVGLVSLYDPTSVEGQQSTIAITGEDPDVLLAVADRQDGLNARHYDDRADAQVAFENRQVNAILDANRDTEGRLAIRVTAPDEGLETTLLIVQLQEVLETAERAERSENADRLSQQPLSLPSEIPASPYFAFTYTILLPLLLFLPVFISGSIAVDSLIEERQRGTLELLRVSPPSLVDIVDAKLLATAALAPVQAGAWLALLAFNGITIASPIALIAFVGALSVVIVGIGLAIALYAPDRRQAQLLYSGMILGALVLASLLPEHPANTVAKFAVGSPTTTTWLLLGGYCLAGLLAYVAVLAGVDRLDPAAL